MLSVSNTSLVYNFACFGTGLHTKKIPNNSIERCNSDGNILHSCRIIVIWSTFLWFILFSLAYFLYKQVSSVGPFYTDFIILNILRQAFNYFGKSAFLILLFICMCYESLFYISDSVLNALLVLFFYMFAKNEWVRISFYTLLL